MQKRIAIIGAGGQGNSLAIKALEQIKDLIVIPKPAGDPLPKIVIKPFNYAYMRTSHDPAPTFFRTRHRNKH